MQHDKVLIEITPNKQAIDKIICWLKSECDINGDGFYHNRNIICDSYKSGKAIVLKDGENDIGLVTWDENELHVNVDIFVIHPKYRGQGYGSFFIKAISEYYRNEGFKAIKLFCEPKSSEQFWQKMGLHKSPDRGYTENELTYYGILVDTASTAYIGNADLIELWDVEPNRVVGKEPKWIWYIETQNEELVYPILQPCNCNWNLRWSRNGKLLKEEKVKNFTDEYNELYSSPLLYIDKLVL